MKDLKIHITKSLASAHAALYELREYEADNPHPLHWDLVRLSLSTVNNLQVMLSDVHKIEKDREAPAGVGEINWRPATSNDELREGDYLKVDVGHYSLEYKAPISMIDHKYGDITFEDDHTYTWSRRHKVYYFRETPDPELYPAILDEDGDLWLWSRSQGIYIETDTATGTAPADIDWAWSPADRRG